MDKKFLIVVIIGLVIIVFQKRIEEYSATLNEVQKLMIAQMLLLGTILILLLYYIFSRSKEE
ncbi:MAG: hypothetical protein U9N35_03235 [Euryarchaeota archaeon]|nr:hypothetical protein [Euryarchaeota archaeon]